MEAKSFNLGRAVIGLAIVLLGLVFLLDNVGFDIGAFWRLGPGVIIIAIGLAKIIGPQSSSSKMFGALLVVLGAFLLFNLWNFWPLLIILFGLYVLWRAVGPKGVPQKGRSTSTVDAIREFVVFGSSEQVVQSEGFQGGEITAVFGGVELDLRDAKPEPGGSIMLDLFVLFGGLDLRIPEDWEFVNESSVIFGGIEDKTRRPSGGFSGINVGIGPKGGAPAGGFGEEKLPPPLSTPRLVLKGYVLFGGIDITN